MTIHRVTNQMMNERAYLSLQTGLGRLARSQEQLTTGRVLNRPSDSPTDTTSAMRMRSALADQRQYARNADDGLGWLGQTDSTLTSVLGQVRRAREVGIQGVNSVAQGTQAREALAVEVEQIRASLLSAADTRYLGRPVFGGITTGDRAYDADGAFVGVPGQVTRTVGDGTRVAVNVVGTDVFGPDGDSLFDDLGRLADALRAGDLGAVQGGLDALSTALDRVSSVLADAGTRYNRVERAAQTARDAELDLTVSLSRVENVDLARATMDLKLHEVAYQAALAATARLVQPSLADFLR
jgi:flagellar hook-associated protein 3 FlgL